MVQMRATAHGKAKILKKENDKKDRKRGEKEKGMSRLARGRRCRED